MIDCTRVDANERYFFLCVRASEKLVSKKREKKQKKREKFNKKKKKNKRKEKRKAKQSKEGRNVWNENKRKSGG